MSEILALMVIGTLTPFLSIIIWSIFKERMQVYKYQFEKWKLQQYKKTPELRIPPKMLVPKTPEDKGIMGLLGGLDKNKIRGILEVLQGEEEGLLEEAPEGKEDLMSYILDIVKDNPDVVKGLVDKFGKGGGEDITVR